MNMSSLARRWLAAPVLALMLLPLHASADEQATLIDQIMATGPLTCNEDAMTMLNAQLLRKGPDQVLDGYRRGLNYDKRWSAGNENYDRARAVIANALADDERKNGPIFAYTYGSAIRMAAREWSMADLRYFAKFFAEPEGRLYWNSIIEGANCSGLLKSVNNAPFQPLEGPQKEHWTKSVAALEGSQQRFFTKLGELAPLSRANFDDAYKRAGTSLSDAPLKAATAGDAALIARIDTVLKPHLPKIDEISRSYQAR